jgi:cytochrome c551/c552
MSFLSDAGSTVRGRVAIALTVLACGGLLGAGCGGDDDSSSSDTGTGTGTTSSTGSGSGGGSNGGGGGADANAAAITVFNSSGCAGCHTLSVADASGAVGPNLDNTSLSKDQIEAQIKSGGGVMPAFEGQLTDTQISSLANLISSN